MWRSVWMPIRGDHSSRFVGYPESAGINRHVVGDERALHLYAKPDAAKGWIDFGVNIRAAQGPRIGGLANLSVALLVFEERCNRIDEIIASFIPICEKNLKG
jgi:hypothetical protein